MRPRPTSMGGNSEGPGSASGPLRKFHADNVAGTVSRLKAAFVAAAAPSVAATPAPLRSAGSLLPARHGLVSSFPLERSKPRYHIRSRRHSVPTPIDIGQGEGPSVVSSNFPKGLIRLANRHTSSPRVDAPHKVGVSNDMYGADKTKCSSR